MIRRHFVAALIGLTPMSIRGPIVGDEDEDLDSYSFEDSGSIVTDPFELAGGFVLLEAEHDDDGLFQVELVDDETGDTEELFINAIDGWEGRTGDTVDSGSYVLDINAEDEWAITLDQPRPDSGDNLPTEHSDEIPEVVGPYELDGRIEATGTHEAEGNYIVIAHDANASEGRFGELVFNEIGDFEGTTTFSGPGLSWVTVEAGGSWSLELD